MLHPQPRERNWFSISPHLSRYLCLVILYYYCLHWKAYYKNQEVERVDLPAVSGDMGVLANHVPTIQQLKPGVIEVLSENGSSDRLFGMDYMN